jgi:cell division protein FtsL
VKTSLSKSIGAISSTVLASISLAVCHVFSRRVLTHKYKQIRQKISEINEQISQKDKLNGELNHLNIQINQIEKSGHKHILYAYVLIFQFD